MTQTDKSAMHEVGADSATDAIRGSDSGMREIDPCFRFWSYGRFDERKAGRKAAPHMDDVGVWRDAWSGAPCDPPQS